MLQVQRYFATDAGWDVLSGLQLYGSRVVLQLDFAQLHAQSGISDLAPAMQYQPVEALGCVAAAVYEVYWARAYHLAGILEQTLPLFCNTWSGEVCSLHEQYHSLNACHAQDRL
jgi:hypothetical protein